MELQQILDAIGQKPELLDGLLQPVLESEKGKLAIANRVKTEVDTKISEEISKTYGRLDEDAFEVLGEKPGTKEEGKKQKTHEFLKEKLTELKDLRDKKGQLDKDPEIQRLTQELEKIKKEGGGSHVQQVFDSAKGEWQTKEQNLLSQIEDLKKQSTEGTKKSAISNAIAAIKFSPDVDEEIKKLVIASAESHLMENSKIDENGKLIFLQADGKPAVNPTTYEPKDATAILADYVPIQKIILKESGHTGASTTVKGNVTTTTVDGKDTKSLTLPEGSFKTRSEFLTVAEQALKDAGITIRDSNYTRLKDEAYKAYKVEALPIE